MKTPHLGLIVNHNLTYVNSKKLFNVSTPMKLVETRNPSLELVCQNFYAALILLLFLLY